MTEEAFKSTMRPVEPIDLGDALAGAWPLADDDALSKMRSIVGDAAAIASNMRALTYLYARALCDDGADTPLTAASHLVIDCIETMACRLEALEIRAAALHAPFVGRAPS